ncbi:VWA domain-containing protein [Phaeobacter sp. B1627]|uniref:VWA domain-containing protein n=1 Tax=Phaeobacter sp. B1627 TaxID=2583809 RepID=UPI001117C981|nr:VWA domain-containing protein [Phaeobacter sp. B1627]TNJ47432.1 VWA domain-containing protein [Phaeobacter sp. B1627]
MIELADPMALCLLPLPFLAARLLPAQDRRGRALIVPDRVAHRLLARSTERRSIYPSGDRIAHLRPWLVWIFLVLALSGPQDLSPVPALKVSGRDLAVVLDLSGSMVRDDFVLNDTPVTRLEAVQQIGADFLRRRGGDRVALIVFGSEAYYAAPFSFDTEAVAQQIEATTIGISGRATNISDGLGLALKRLADSEAETRVVVLLSDGKNNAGATNPVAVAELAASLGVRIHTIALGPRDTEDAGKEERGVVDAATLRAIADVSGGESFRVRTSADLAAVTHSIDQLEATVSAGLAAEVYRPLWLWPAAISFLLLLWHLRQDMA